MLTLAILVGLALLGLWFWSACAMAALADRAREEALEELVKEKGNDS